MLSSTNTSTNNNIKTLNFLSKSRQRIARKKTLVSFQKRMTEITELCMNCGIDLESGNLP